MNGVMKVVQVEPTLTNQAVLVRFISVFGSIFLNAWLVMLIIPVITPFALGYWQSMLLILGVRMIIGDKFRILPSSKDVK